MTVSRRGLLRGVCVAGSASVASAVGPSGLGDAGAGGDDAAGAAVVDDPAGPSAESPEADALVAGSLLRLGNRVPGATVEAHGSVAVRRLVLNGMRDPDAVALADPRLFAGLSDRTTLFATNALVLAYHPDSAFADPLERDWRRALERDGIRLGRTDPEVDPLGYRTVMALRLGSDRNGLDDEGVLSTSRIVRETDVLNLLEGGQLDAAFVYRNMAVQRDLPAVALPDAIDFSDPSHADVYRSVTCEVGGETVRGAPIRYAATATTPAGAPWVDELVGSATLLRRAGFVVPDDYPRRERRLADVTSS